ncbi:MAG: hypothetical protein PWQ91_256 [Eubacteriales bacterium]|nr:hypothetical protein [Eubacteriales bacterium]MDN5363195.1 hypothetical protein [Eubacteriales bacterium]
MRYIDVEDRAFWDYPQLAEMLQKEQLVLPIVTINDEIVGSGYVTYLRLAEELEARGIKAVV